MSLGYCLSVFKAIGFWLAGLCLALGALVEANGQSDEWRASIQNADALYQQGWYTQAAVVADACSPGGRAGSRAGDHPDVATSPQPSRARPSRARRLRRSRRAAGARAAILEKLLGPEHHSVAIAIGNLAELYQAQGRYADAEGAYKRALANVESALGPQYPNVATGSTALPGCTTRSSASMLRSRCTSARLQSGRAFGPNNPAVAASLNNLAALYRARGEYAAAEPLYRRSLDIALKRMGEGHPPWRWHEQPR